jgi:hypothetical protein
MSRMVEERIVLFKVVYKDSVERLVTHAIAQCSDAGTCRAASVDQLNQELIIFSMFYADYCLESLIPPL